MRSSFRFPSLLTLISLWLTLFATSCSKDEPKPIAPGAIEARIMPVGSVRSVTMIGAGGRTYQTVPDATTGAFSFTGLTPGRYTLSFETILAYKAPAPLALDVQAGTTSKPLLAALTRDTKIRGTMTWTVGSNNYSANILGGHITSEFMELNAKDSTATGNQDILFILPKEENQNAIFRGVGSYPLGTALFPRVRYDAGRVIHYAYPPSVSPTTGVITVTAFDSKTFTIAGTFEFTAFAYYNGLPATPSASITVTRGVFNLTF